MKKDNQNIFKNKNHLYLESNNSVDDVSNIGSQKGTLINYNNYTDENSFCNNTVSKQNFAENSNLDLDKESFVFDSRKNSFHLDDSGFINNMPSRYAIEKDEEDILSDIENESILKDLDLNDKKPKDVQNI